MFDMFGIYRTGVTWRDQNLGRKVEVIYMDELCNALILRIALGDQGVKPPEALAILAIY